jgi:hypothetical protein
MGAELQSCPLPKFIRATIGTPCLLPQTVGERTKFLFSNLRTHFQPRKVFTERAPLSQVACKHPPSPGNWDIVYVKSKTSSLSAWLDNEPFTSVGTEQFHCNQLRLRRERYAGSHPPRFCRQKRQGQCHGAHAHWSVECSATPGSGGRTECFRHDFCDLLLPMAGKVKRLPDNLCDATKNLSGRCPYRSACLQSHSSDAVCHLRNGDCSTVGSQPTGDENGYPSHRATRAQRRRLRSRLPATRHPTKRHRERTSERETRLARQCPTALLRSCSQRMKTRRNDAAEEANQVGVAPGAMRHPSTAGTGDQLRCYRVDCNSRRSLYTITESASGIQLSSWREAPYYWPFCLMPPGLLLTSLFAPLFVP